MHPLDGSGRVGCNDHGTCRDPHENARRRPQKVARPVNTDGLGSKHGERKHLGCEFVPVLLGGRAPRRGGEQDRSLSVCAGESATQFARTSEPARYAPSDDLGRVGWNDQGTRRGPHSRWPRRSCPSCQRNGSRCTRSWRCWRRRRFRRGAGCCRR